MLNQNIKAVGATGFFVSILSMNAAFITWENSIPIDDAGAFVNTSGTLIAAINSDDSGEDSLISTVNFVGHDLASWNSGIVGVDGVTITSNTANGNFGNTFVQGTGSPPGITNNSPLDNLISSAIWNPQTITLEGLTIGNTYFIQIIGSDSRNGRDSNNVTILTDGVNALDDGISMNTVGINPLSNTTPGAGNPALAGHAILGTFEADAETQSFDIFGSTNGGESNNSGGRAQINGFQLRTFAVGADADSDNDGMNDLYELINGLDIDDASDANIDSDGDGILNIDEFNNDPQLPAGNSDADSDGLSDGEEVDGLLNTFGTPVTNLLTDGVSLGAATNPFEADSDSDGINDLDEVEGSINIDFSNEATNPNSDDTDDDEISDNNEISFMLDPNDGTGDNGGAGDPDDDLVSNAEEVTAGTSPFLADTDDDGVNDRVEIDTEGLLPLDPDTDNDKILDGEEIIAGEDGFITNPLSLDSDADGVPDPYEIMEGVDPSEATGAAISPNYAPISWVVESFDDYQLSDGTEVIGVGTAGIQAGGTLLYAENYRGADLTINGVPFSGFSSEDQPRCSPNVLTLLINSTNLGTLYAGPITELNPLLDSIWFNFADNLIPHVLMTGLTVGETYFVQIGTSDNRPGREGRYAVLDGTFGSNDASVNVGATNTIFGGPDSPALLFTGTFTATLPTQMFDIQAFDTTGNLDENQVFMAFLQVRAGVPQFTNPSVIGIASTGFDENGDFLIELTSDAAGATVSESPDLETEFTPLTNGVSILGNVITISGAVIDSNGDNSSYFRVSR